MPGLIPPIMGGLGPPAPGMIPPIGAFVPPGTMGLAGYNPIAGPPGFALIPPVIEALDP